MLSLQTDLIWSHRDWPLRSVWISCRSLCAVTLPVNNSKISYAPNPSPTCLDLLPNDVDPSRCRTLSPSDSANGSNDVESRSIVVRARNFRFRAMVVPPPQTLCLHSASIWIKKNHFCSNSFRISAHFTQTVLDIHVFMHICIYTFVLDGLCRIYIKWTKNKV